MKEFRNKNWKKTNVELLSVKLCKHQFGQTHCRMRSATVILNCR